MYRLARALALMPRYLHRTAHTAVNTGASLCKRALQQERHRATDVCCTSRVQRLCAVVARPDGDTVEVQQSGDVRCMQALYVEGTHGGASQWHSGRGTIQSDARDAAKPVIQVPAGWEAAKASDVQGA